MIYFNKFKKKNVNNNIIKLKFLRYTFFLKKSNYCISKKMKLFMIEKIFFKELDKKKEQLFTKNIAIIIYSVTWSVNNI